MSVDLRSLIILFFALIFGALLIAIAYLAITRLDPELLRLVLGVVQTGLAVILGWACHAAFKQGARSGS